MMRRPYLSLPFVLIAIMELSSTSRLAAQTDLRGQVNRRSAEEVSVLLEALDDDDERIRSLATERLLEMGADAVPSLRIALRNGNPRVYPATYRLLAKIGQKGVPVLIEGLTNQNVLVRVEAADALSGMGKEAIPELCKVLRCGALTDCSDTGDYVSQNAQETAVVRRFTLQQDPQLRREYKQADLRRETAKVLGSIGEESENAVAAIPVLVETLNDNHENVRVAAGESLQNIGKAAIPALREVLMSDNSSARYTATCALGVIGQEIAEVAPVLGEATKHEDLRVRIAAVDALSLANVPLVRTEAAKVPDGVYSDTVTAIINSDIVTKEIDEVAKVILKESGMVVPMLGDSVTDPNKRVRLLTVLAVSRFGEVAAGAERRATDANVEIVVKDVKEAAKEIVTKANSAAPNLSDEDKDAMAVLIDAALRETVEKALHEAVEVNRSVRVAAEQVLHKAAKDRDAFVSIAATRALRKLAPQIPVQPAASEKGSPP